jgi:hypothetical protein
MSWVQHNIVAATSVTHPDCAIRCCTVKSDWDPLYVRLQVVVVLFSIFVQGACGASFGVVPFVSLRAREYMLWHMPAGRQLACMTAFSCIEETAAFNRYAVLPQRSLDMKQE